MVAGPVVVGAVKAGEAANGDPAPPGQFVIGRSGAIHTDPPATAWAGRTANGAARTTKATINGTNSLMDGFLNLILHRYE